jgi:hypothetical protein
VSSAVESDTPYCNSYGSSDMSEYGSDVSKSDSDPEGVSGATAPGGRREQKLLRALKSLLVS